MAKKKEIKTEKEEIQEVGAVLYRDASIVSKSMNDWGMAKLGCTDGEHQFVLFKTKVGAENTYQIGDTMIVYIDGLYDKVKRTVKRIEKKKAKEDKKKNPKEAGKSEE